MGLGNHLGRRVLRNLGLSTSLLGRDSCSLVRFRPLFRFERRGSRFVLRSFLLRLGCESSLRLFWGFVRFLAKRETIIPRRTTMKGYLG